MFAVVPTVGAGALGASSAKLMPVVSATLTFAGVSETTVSVATVLKSIWPCAVASTPKMVAVTSPLSCRLKSLGVAPFLPGAAAFMLVDFFVRVHFMLRFLFKKTTGELKLMRGRGAAHDLDAGDWRRLRLQLLDERRQVLVQVRGDGFLRDDEPFDQQAIGRVQGQFNFHVFSRKSFMRSAEQFVQSDVIDELFAATRDARQSRRNSGLGHHRRGMGDGNGLADGLDRRDHGHEKHALQGRTV